MHIAEEELSGGILKLILDGRLDIEGARVLDLKMKAVADSRKAVIVDLQRVSFLGSIGLRSLVLPARTIRDHGGKIVLFGPNELVEKVLKISGIDTLIPLHHELESALADLQ